MPRGGIRQALPRGGVNGLVSSSPSPASSRLGCSVPPCRPCASIFAALLSGEEDSRRRRRSAAAARSTRFAARDNFESVAVDSCPAACSAFRDASDPPPPPPCPPSHPPSLGRWSGLLPCGRETTASSSGTPHPLPTPPSFPPPPPPPSQSPSSASSSTFTGVPLLPTLAPLDGEEPPTSPPNPDQVPPRAPTAGVDGHVGASSLARGMRRVTTVCATDESRTDENAADACATGAGVVVASPQTASLRPGS